jgi:hypothetical protein
MAFPFEAAEDQDAVRAPPEGVQDVIRIDLSAAGHGDPTLDLGFERLFTG